MSFIKKIHYCWIGGDVPDSVQTQVGSWKQLCPHFDFVEWNNTNVSYSDFEEYSFWRRTYSEHRWGFAADIVKFSKIYEEGGFYLDCDVVMCKSLSTIPAPPDHLIMGYMYDGVISGGFLYAPPRHPLLKKLLEYYQDINDGFYAVSNTIVTDCINANVPDILLNGKYFSSDKYKITVFPKEYFCQPSFNPAKPFLLDQFAGSWHKSGGKFLTNRGKMNLYRVLRRKVSLFRQIMRNEFRDVYLNALIGRKILRMEHWRTRYGITGGAVKNKSLSE